MQYDILLVAGGTAGHVFPALAIAEELKARGRSFYFLSVESGIAKKEGAVNRYIKDKYPSSFLKVRGFKVARGPIALVLKNILPIWNLIFARRKAWHLLRRIQPQVIITTGGYASLPTGLVAKSEKIPLILFEPNVIAGRANKILAKRATTVVIGFSECLISAGQHLGIPVRKQVLDVNRKRKQTKTKKELSIKNQLEIQELVVIVGGSLGASKFNQTLLEALPKLLERKSLCIFHIVGERDWDMVAAQAIDIGLDTPYHPIKFEDNMEQLFEAADLFISRAGASTLAELEATQTPAIIIPWKGAVSNHQLENAKNFCTGFRKNGGAELLLEDDLTAATLTEKITEFLDGKVYVEPEKSSLLKSRTAAKEISDLLERYC